MIILDTCALMWLVNSPADISIPAATAIRAQARELAVVPISAWEVAVKTANGGLQLPGGVDPFSWYRTARERYGLREIPLSASLLCRAAALPPIHRDPSDPMIIAAAIESRLPVVTADPVFGRYPGVTVVW